MIIAIAILLPLLLASVWFFIRVQSKNAQNIALYRYNIAVALVAIFASVALSLYFWQTIGQSVDRGWWPVLAALGSILIISVLLVLGTFIRLIIFKKKV